MGRQIFRFHIKHQGIYNFFTLFLHFFYTFLQLFYKPETPPPPPHHPYHSGLRGAPPHPSPDSHSPTPPGPLPPQPEGLVPNHGFPLVFQIPTCPDTKPGTHTFCQTLAPFLHAIETPLPTALITKCLLAVGSHGFGKRLDWNPTPGVRSSVNEVHRTGWGCLSSCLQPLWPRACFPRRCASLGNVLITCARAHFQKQQLRLPATNEMNQSVNNP